MSLAVIRADFVDALRSRNRRGINRNALRLLEADAPLRSEWFSVANVLVSNGEVALAVEAARRGADESNGAPSAQFQFANVLADVGRHDDALTIVSEIPAQQLGPAERDHFLGTCALEIGDFEVAREAFDRVVTGWPTAGPAWLSLSALPRQDDAALLKRLDSASSAMRQARPDDVAQWHYARGNVLDRIGKNDQAFAEFSAGARLIRPTRPYDLQADQSQAGALISDFDAAAMTGMARQISVPTSRPIFVIGLPRSGTTLIEQILVSHSGVAGGGELPFGAILEREIRDNRLAKLERFAAANGADELARLYLHLGDERFGKGARFVDKNVDNSRTLGILASVLPEAPIMWLRRDPLDCAWSCFRTFFSRGVEWSWSLTDIAAHFQAEDRLFEHWQQALGDRILTVRYEELVADAADGTRRILAHAGLEPEAAGPAHETRRPVLTASVAQVRQPIYQTSVGSAGRYAEQLKPFIEAYCETSDR